MKVVQINAVCGFGSTGRIACELSDYFQDHEIENMFFYGSGDSDRENTVPIGNKLDHKFHAVFSRISGKQGYFSVRATRKMLKQMDKIQPDIIHLHNLHANYINLPLLFEYIIKNEIATVITLHDCFFYTGKCVHYTMAGCERWKQNCGQCPQLKSGNASWGLDRTKKMLNDRRKWFQAISRLGVIGVSNWVTNEAKQSVLSGATQFRTIYNWIDLNIFKPHQTDILEKLGIQDKFVILGVAISWEKAKGMDDFNRLAQMLDDRFQIILVGTKTEPLHERILHIERTEDIQMMSDLYAASDVFYNPTRRETFGKTTAESLACGTPAIVYRTTACPELVGENCGFVEEVGDVKAVYKDIMVMHQEKKDYTDVCRNFANEKFHKDVLLDETIKFYQDLLLLDRKRG